MALTADIVTSAALRILADFGLGDLTMRRLARELDVQPSALYWHVADKQSLFVLLAQRMAQEADRMTTTGDPVEDLLHYRRVLLRYRESADIVLLAFAHSGSTVLPTALTHLPAPDADAVTHFVLGSIAVQQSRALFAQQRDEPAEQTGLSPEEAAEATFLIGIRRLLPQAAAAPVRGEAAASPPPLPGPLHP